MGEFNEVNSGRKVRQVPSSGNSVLFGWSDSGIERLLRFALNRSPFYSASVEVTPDRATAEDFWSFPLISKETIIADQGKFPPFGSLMAVHPSELERIYVSAGLYIPMAGTDLRTLVGGLTSLWAEYGVGAGDIVDVSTSYHGVLSGTVSDASFRAVGATVVPSGPGRTDERLRILAQLRVSVLRAFTPYALTLADRAREAGLDPLADFAVRLLIIGGELRDPSAKGELEATWGARCLETYGTAETGVVAADALGCGAGMHFRGGVVAELIDPSTGEHETGDTGELVLSDLRRIAQPFIRFRTGDIVKVDRTACACGRSSPRLVAVIGRAGRLIRVRGLFVDPEKVGATVRRLAPGAEVEITVSRSRRQDELIIAVSSAEAGEDAIASAIKDATGIMPEVELRPRGVRDGAVRDLRFDASNAGGERRSG